MTYQRRTKKELLEIIASLERRLSEGEDLEEKRRDAEERLKRSEERYQALTDNIPHGIYRRTPGPEGKLIMVNKISTIESLQGADMVLAETRGVESLRKHGLACVFRALFPLGMELPEGPSPFSRRIPSLPPALFAR